MSEEVPTKDRIMALLSEPSQDVYLIVEDARWIKGEIERLEAENAELREERDYWMNVYKAELKESTMLLRALTEVDDEEGEG